MVVRHEMQAEQMMAHSIGIGEEEAWEDGCIKGDFGWDDGWDDDDDWSIRTRKK